jgi:histidinol-phosphate aminotransferase
MSGRFERLKEYAPGEQPQDKRYIKLNTNESPFPPSPAVSAAVNERAVLDLRLYSDPRSAALKAALAGQFGVSSENVFVGNGSDEILSFAFMAFCEKGEKISYPEISYGFYPVFAELYELQKNELALRDDFSIDPKMYHGLDTMIVLANPNAPTGLCLSPEEIGKIASSNPDRVVVVDEAYVDFGAESVAALTKELDNLLVVQTFSKSRSLAGARLGFALGNKELISDLEKLKFSTNPYNVNRLSLAAGVAALNEQEYYDNNCKKIIATREYTSKELAKMGFWLTESRANFLFARHPGIDGQELYLTLKERGILVRHFSKPRLRDFVRITIGRQEDMERLVLTVKEILENA